MKRSLLILLGLASMIHVKAQSFNVDDAGTSGKAPTNKSVYAEAGGGGLIFSANFDSRFPGTDNLGYRVGLGVFPSNNTVVTLPFGVYYLIGNEPNYFEVEVTAAVATSEYQFKSHKSIFFFYPHVGYRLNKTSNAFFFKIEVGAMFVGSEVVPFPGLGLGYTLGK